MTPLAWYLVVFIAGLVTAWLWADYRYSRAVNALRNKATILRLEWEGCLQCVEAQAAEVRTLTLQNDELARENRELRERTHWLDQPTEEQPKSADPKRGCYYGTDECSGPLWQCANCREWFCTLHMHMTEEGVAVECVYCESTRKE